MGYDPKYDGKLEDPKFRTDPEPPQGKDDDFSNLNKIEDRVNMELFYNQQITNLNMSWILHHKESNLSVVGITQEHTYGFSVENSYNANGGGAVGQALSSFINSVHSTISSAVPLKNQIAGSWKDQIRGIGNNLSLEDQIQAAGGRDNAEMSIGGTVQDLTSRGLLWAADAIESANNKLKDKDWIGNRVLSYLFEGNDTPTLDNLANGKMITATDKVLSYSGSNLSVTLPVLKTFIFHNPVGDTRMNVLELVENLVRVAAPKTTRSSIKGLYALQNPPGNYHVNFNAFDGQTDPMEGTWTLTWNGYTVKNLLISNLTVNYSKYNAMDNRGQDSGDPLYAEIDITLALASMLMTDDISRLMTVKRDSKGRVIGRTRMSTSGWDDSDESSVGVVSKDQDISGIGTNRTSNLNKYNSTSL